MIAFLGMGLLGSGFVRALREGRGRARLEPHAGEGARARGRRREGVRRSGARPRAAPTRVHLALSDDAAVDERARAPRSSRRARSSSITRRPRPPGARARAARWTDIAFQHAPVFMGPQNALESTGLMLAPAIARASTRSRRAREDDRQARLPRRARDAAAAFKLMGNLFLMCVHRRRRRHARARARRSASRPPRPRRSSSTSTRARRSARARSACSTARFAHASWELAMARKDARLMLEEAGAQASRSRCCRRSPRAWIASSRAATAHDDWTVIAKDFVC